MLTSALVRGLVHAESEWAIRMYERGLERLTGQRTADLLKFYSSESFSVSDRDWYSQNGYHRLASIIGGGFTSHAGIPITPDTAFQSSAFYAAVKIIAEDMGSMPFFVYRRAADRTVEKAYDDPLYRCLHDLPNPDVGAGEFVEALTTHALIGLDGFAEIQRVGQSIYLWPWDPMKVKVDKTSRGKLVFRYPAGEADERTYEQSRVFHLRGYTMDCQRSDPILHRARHILGLTLAQQEYVGRYFANDATPGVIIQRSVDSPTMTPDEKLAVKRAWMEWHGSLRRKHEPAILEPGATATRLDPDHTKLQLVEQRKFQVIEVCRLLRIAPHKLADLERTTFNNMSELETAHKSMTLRPWIRRWRQSVYRCLLTTDQQIADSLYAEHDVEQFQSGNFEAQSEGFRKLLEKGVYSINDVRRFMNLNPIDGGDDHLVQINLATVQDVAAGLARSSNGTQGSPTPNQEA